MNISNALSGLQDSLEHAVSMVGNLSRDKIVSAAPQQAGDASAICLRLDMIRDCLSVAQRRISEIEGTMRHSYRDDVESVLKSLDI